jgi:hypothetical protein
MTAHACASTQPKIINWDGIPTRLKLSLQVLPRIIALLEISTARPFTEMQLHKLSASRLMTQAVPLITTSCTMPGQAFSLALLREAIKSWLFKLVEKEPGMLHLPCWQRLPPTLDIRSLVFPTQFFTSTPMFRRAMLPFALKRME